MGQNLVIRFDGPPGPEAGRFVEVEDGHGHSIKVGEWSQDGDYYLLTIPYNFPTPDPRVEEAEKRAILCNREAIRLQKVSLKAEETVERLRESLRDVVDLYGCELPTKQRDQETLLGAILLIKETSPS